MILSFLQFLTQFAIAFLAIGHVLFFLRRTRYLKRCIFTVLLLGVYAFYLLLLAAEERIMPLQNANEVFQMAGFLLLLFLLATDWFCRDKQLVSLFVPFACLLGGMGIFFARAFANYVYRPNIEFLGTWQERFLDLEFGKFFLILGYATLFYAFMVSLLQRITLAEIKEKQSSFFISRLPSITVLETFLTFFLAAFLFLLGVVFLCKYALVNILPQFGLVVQNNLLPSLLAWLAVLSIFILRINFLTNSRMVFVALSGSLGLVLINLLY